MESIAFKQMML